MNNKKTIPEKREGLSSLGGTNAGKYPNHHFIHNSNVETESRWPLKVVVCGEDEWINGCSRYRKNTNIFSLELITEGSLEFYQRGVLHQVQTGELLVIQPELDCKMAAYEYCRKKIMIIGGYMLPTFLASGGWSDVDVLKPANPEMIAGYFDRVYEACRTPQPGYLNYSSSQAYELLLELSSNISQGGIPPELNRILCFLDENIGSNLTMEAISQRFGLSRTTLFRLFKKHLDCSPANYIINKRLLVAHNLLESTHASIKEISARLGYANQFFFSSQFKQHFKMSPKAFRQIQNSSEIRE